MTTPFRILSFNINGFGLKEEQWKKKRTPLILATLRKYAPHIMGLQEVTTENLAMLQAEFPEYGIISGNKYGDTPPEEQTPILWHESHFTCLDHGEFWFSNTPDEPSIGFGMEYMMGATWAIFEDLKTKHRLLHINTHLEDGVDAEQCRVECSKVMLEKTTALGQNLPTILTGDFNCNPWSSPYRKFMEVGFEDSYRAAGHADHVGSSTFHGYRGDDYFALDWGGNELFWRVDWILGRGGAQQLQTVSSSVIRDAMPPLFPSDHYPITTEFIIL